MGGGWPEVSEVVTDDWILHYLIISVPQGKVFHRILLCLFYNYVSSWVTTHAGDSSVLKSTIGCMFCAG